MVRAHKWGAIRSGITYSNTISNSAVYLPDSDIVTAGKILNARSEQTSERSLWSYRHSLNGTESKG